MLRRSAFVGSTLARLGFYVNVVAAFSASLGSKPPSTVQSEQLGVWDPHEFGYAKEKYMSKLTHFFSSFAAALAFAPSPGRPALSRRLSNALDITKERGERETATKKAR